LDFELLFVKTRLQGDEIWWVMMEWRLDWNMAMMFGLDGGEMMDLKKEWVAARNSERAEKVRCSMDFVVERVLGRRNET
jgi:hypothetical protein